MNECIVHWAECVGGDGGSSRASSEFGRGRGQTRPANVALLHPNSHSVCTLTNQVPLFTWSVGLRQRALRSNSPMYASVKSESCARARVCVVVVEVVGSGAVVVGG
jgi:hypothetical protein